MVGVMHPEVEMAEVHQTFLKFELSTCVNSDVYFMEAFAFWNVFMKAIY